MCAIVLINFFIIIRIGYIEYRQFKVKEIMTFSSHLMGKKFPNSQTISSAVATFSKSKVGASPRMEPEADLKYFHISLERLLE